MVLGDCQTINPYSRGFYGAFLVLNTSRKDLDMFPKLVKGLGPFMHTFGVFTVLGDPQTVNPYTRGLKVFFMSYNH